MQSFLGVALFFKSHVANFSDQAANLHKMTHNNFNWGRKTWKEDYEGDFKKMKLPLSDLIANRFPDLAERSCETFTDKTLTERFGTVYGREIPRNLYRQNSHRTFWDRI